MNYFLAKTEPQSYSVKQLKSDGTTVWDGVRNAQALTAIRKMRPGDRVFIYHSGGESAIVGVARVASDPRPDPSEDNLTVVEFKFEAFIDPPVSLKDIKATHLFDDWSLVRQSRLSTMSVPPEFIDWLRSSHTNLHI